MRFFYFHLFWRYTVLDLGRVGLNQPLKIFQLNANSLKYQQIDLNSLTFFTVHCKTVVFLQFWSTVLDKMRWCQPLHTPLARSTRLRSKWAILPSLIFFLIKFFWGGGYKLLSIKFVQDCNLGNSKPFLHPPKNGWSFLKLKRVIWGRGWRDNQKFLCILSKNSSSQVWNGKGTFYVWSLF